MGYVVLQAGATLDEEALRRVLRLALPAYMVPSRIVALPFLPVLSSGKLDRHRLPAPEAPRRPVSAGMPATPGEAVLRACWGRVLHLEDVGLDEDFFLDLGGHSLLAAVMVSELRREASFASLSVPDIYAFPTVRGLARELEGRAAARVPERDPRPRIGALGRRLCQGAQWAGLYPILGFFGFQWLAPYLTYSWLIDHDKDRTVALGAVGIVLLLVNPVMFMLSILAKWALLGRVRPGVHPLWGPFYWRWWLAGRIQAATPVGYLVGTPWMRVYLRLMGARIGRHVHLATDSIRVFDLLEVGEDTCIGVDARLEGYAIHDGLLHIGPIVLGRRCCVGARSVLEPGSRMEDGAVLGDLALLPGGAVIPRDQHWVGSPARLLPGEGGARGAAHRPGRMRVVLVALVQGLGAFLVPVCFLAAIFPGMVALNELWLRIPGYFGYLWAVPLVAVSYIVLLGLLIVGVKWAVVGRVEAGTYELTSSAYVRKWFVDQLMEVSLDLMGPLYATLYLNPWYRALGARLGRGAEISTAGAVTPDLLDVGEEAFIADAASLGLPHYDLGRVTLAPTRVGRRAFVGNSSAVPGGTTLGDLALVGVLSVPPLDSAEAARTDASWMGSPAIFLPRRQHAPGFQEEQTYKPSRRLVALRLCIEFFRVTLPAMGFVVLTCLLLTATTVLEEVGGLPFAILLFPVLYFLGGVAACLMVAAVKWILIGRYVPGEKPLWCSFVWRTELVTALQENLAGPWLLTMALGTPLPPLFFRLLGARIGAGVHMESAWLTEYDLIRLGPDVCLGPDCTLQTHLFEDRVMKMSTIDLGPGCSVGTDAVVLYDTRMEAGSRLGDLSLLMKGETLPQGTSWQGSPARGLP